METAALCRNMEVHSFQLGLASGYPVIKDLAASAQNVCEQAHCKMVQGAAIAAGAEAQRVLGGMRERVKKCSDKIASVIDQPALARLMDSKWNKTYGPNETFWKGALKDEHNRGKEPYFCPGGWTRYGVRVENFDQRWAGSAVCYHGTKQENVTSMLTSGVRGTHGMWDEGHAVGY